MPATMTPRPLLALVSLLLLAGCDAVTGPAALEEGDPTPHRSISSALAPASAGVALCHRTEGGDTYERVVVSQDEAAVHVGHGDERAGRGRLGRDCRPVEAAAPSCPCFGAADLADPVGGVSPVPYVVFDVYGYYSEDLRRTEARTTLHIGDRRYEEVAAVYITPTGDPGAPLAPLCFRQDVGPDDVTGEPAYSYETLSVTIAEAEACRAEVAAYAAAEGTACEGGACGLPFTDDHLDPDFGPYHEDAFRTPAPVLDALRARVAAVQARLAPIL